MKKFGIIGYKGKIGSTLLGRADFVKIDCDVTDISTIEAAVAVVGGEFRHYCKLFCNFLH